MTYKKSESANTTPKTSLYKSTMKQLQVEDSGLRPNKKMNTRAITHEPAVNREGRNNTLSVKQSSCVLKNAELQKAQQKNGLALIMQVD